MKRVLESRFSEDRHLTQEEACIEFIARSMIKIVADDIYGERWGREPQEGSAIRCGRDVIAQADRVYPAIEICKEAERQILATTGNERHFSWVLDALAKANREMLAWTGGPFPHDRLPGPAT
ncbi:MAG TPA: hypothetical protein VK687_03725, partial [Bryobacteraceae bacterium]|nr:hypothetical protein [Bryobacteraceae bacterium]